MAASNKQIYVFGDWRLDPTEHLLSHKGTPIPLTPKVFDTLLLLVENSGRLVTKEEFMKRVWPDAFVEDLALVQNISQIRKALATSSGAENGALIETVPKRGYRFLPTVQMVTEGPAKNGVLQERQTGSEAVAASGQPTIDKDSTKAQESRNRVLIMAGVGIAIVLTAVVALTLGWHRGKRLAANDRVLLSDFENQTGDPAFDAILKQALQIKLTESPYLNLVPDSEVRQALGSSGSPAGLPRQAALNVCNSVRGKAVLAGGISRSGQNAYRINLSALRCPDGASMAQAEANSSSRDDVISAVGLAADTLRRRLGEANESLEQFQSELGRATTNSLPALKAFSLEKKRGPPARISSPSRTTRWQPTSTPNSRWPMRGSASFTPTQTRTNLPTPTSTRPSNYATVPQRVNVSHRRSLLCDDWRREQAR